jgi:hypothetical protein
MTDAVLVRSERLAAREIGGEMVLLMADDSALLVLNELGTAVWQAADGQTPLAAIARAICRDYDVDYDTALRDVREFADALAAAGALAVVAPRQGEIA